MIDPIVQSRLAELQTLCRQFGVRRLELFGSAATGQFHPQQSDLDFLVEFDTWHHLGYADRYFGLLWALEEMFGCPVDLVNPATIENPFLRQSIDASRMLLYAA